jgi:hypothetical protein
MAKANKEIAIYGRQQEDIDVSAMARLLMRWARERERAKIDKSASEIRKAAS